MSSSRIGTASMANASTLDDDVLMSKEHKQTLREYRDQLVDNMYPDDILNQLQSQKVLTHRDVSRIKEKGSAEAMNECLLDTMMRKPDRCYEEFIHALRESDQHHVANIIDKNRTSTPKQSNDNRKKHLYEDVKDEEDIKPSTSQKRKYGEIGVRLHTDRLEFEEDDDNADIDSVRLPKRKQRVTKDEADDDLEIEQEKIKKKLDIKLLKVISKEVDNLDNIVSQKFTQQSVSMRKAALETIKELQKYRREIIGVDFGSVLFRIVCKSIEALEDLYLLCTSGKLAALAEQIVTRRVLKQYRLRKVTIAVTINRDDYQRCKEELLGPEGTGIHSVRLRPKEQPQDVVQTANESKKEISIQLEGDTEQWPGSHEDLNIVRYLSLRSPTHSQSPLEEAESSRILCRKSAEGTLQTLDLNEKKELLGVHTSISELSYQDILGAVNRSPSSAWRRRGRERIRQRLKGVKKSLSLSPAPPDKHLSVNLKPNSTKSRSHSSPERVK